MYSRYNEAALPADDTDLTTPYTDEEETTVGTRNNSRVGQTATDEYMIHQFKGFVGSATICTFEWEGRSTLGPSSSAAHLQVYNRTSAAWETIFSNSASAANIDFELYDTVRDLTNYKDESGVVSCRVYQLATSPSVEYELLTDYFDILLPITYTDKYSGQGTQYVRKYKPLTSKKHI